MIRLGVNTMIWCGGYDGRQLALLPLIREMGYDTVELPVFDFDAVDPVPVRRALADCDLSLTVTSALPHHLSIVSADAVVRRDTREWLLRGLAKTAEMGGSLLAGPMYSPVGYLPGRRRSEDEWSCAVDEFTALARDIESAGVRLAIEPLNRFETYFLNTAADAGSLCDSIGSVSVGVLFDTFHANIEERRPLEACRSLGRQLFHVHLSENDRGVPGSGHVPFDALARTLREMNYAGDAVVESFASTIPELACATAMWRDYAASPETFARAAFAHLRPLFPSV